MLGRLNIRGKIFAVVAVPILVLVIAAITVTANATQTYTAADNSAQLIEVAEVSHNLTTALQTERDAGVNFLHFFRYATDERDTREVDTDAAYQNILTALTSAPADYRDEATSARATLDAILTRYGVDANGNFVDFGSGSDGSYSLAAARAIDVVIEPIMGTDPDGNTIIVGYEDWPVWPDAPTMRRLEDVYSRLEAEVLDLAERTPAGTGMVDEMNRYGQLLGVERTSATSFLTTLETYVVPTGSVSTIIPDFAGTYQDLYLSAQEAVDEGIEELRTALTNLKTNSVNADTRSALVAALDSLATLEERRETVRHQSVGPGALSGWYHTAIGNLISSLYATAGVLPNRGIAEALTAFAEIDTLIEAIRLEEMTGLRIIRQAEFTDSDPRTGYIDLYARTNAALEAAQVAVGRVQGVPELPDFGISFDATDNINWEGIRTRLRNDQVGFVRTLGWSGQIVEEVEEGILPVQNAVWNKANNLASNATRSALAQAILTAVGAAVILGLSLIIAWIIAKRIIDPLRRLTTTATAVRQELPRLVERVALPGQTVDVSEVQIPVESSDEVGRLAEAFNAVNAATLTIAGEQAALRGSISEMFVNVARRDQVLLNRQLASIDEMERSQDDPDTLTRLFALDHLATRMRRNSESLLVLAGIDTGRRMRRPMPLSDVIRTASSEIELYERIQLELDADPSMVGHSALTAGHLFAELLENATVFSDPGTPVVVRTTRKEESVIVEIVDLGIGMTPEELHEANARVRSTAASEILGAQRLGLFVVGRIARRLGARVEIVSEEGKGTTATVTMPLSLFDFTAEPELDRKSESTVDKALHVPTALIGHHGEDEVMDVYSDDVMTPAIAGASYQKPEEVDEEIALLIQEDAELAPETEEVDLTELVEGKTSKGLPARKRRTGAKKEAARDTTSVLGLPETPTSGQLEQMKAGGQGFTPEDAEEASTAEQRSALFRGFRARRTEEGGEIDPNIESLGHVARRDAVTADEPVPLLEEPAPEAEFVPEPEAELAPEFEVESMSEPEAEITWESEAEEEPLPEPEVELALESEPEEEFQLESEAPPEAEISVEPMILEDAEPVAEAVSEASSEEWDITDIGEEDETIPVSLPSDLDVSAVAIPVPEFESAEGTADAWEAASVEPEDVTELTTEGVGEMPAPASEDGPRFSWESVPAADETVPTLEEVLQPKREAAVDEPVEAVPAAGKKPRKDKRGLFGGRKKKEGPAPSAEETPPPVEDGGAIPVTPPSGEVQVAEEGPVEPTGYALEAESSEAEALGTDVATPEQASEVEYDEWGLPVARSWPPAETLDEETSPAPVYDEWGLPVVDGPAVANELDLPPEGVPSPVYPEEPMEEETPAGAPIVGETDGADLPPLTTDEWAMPSAEDITVGEPEAITWGVETVEVAEPVVDTPDLAGLQVSDETPYYEAPPVTDEVAYETPAAVEETPYFEAPPVTDGVAYEMPAAVEETPYFEAPPATDGVAYEMPAAVEET
ncbi:MAG: nitrate- and nitrite sensing domain-containing protein, partial [Demequinaceae bacterium]|nr:nitrate- and nitrite sensing domain-containing protein [Demequinaceae bacterium]